MRDTLGEDDEAARAVLHGARASSAGPPSRAENAIERITRARIHTSRAQRPVPAGSCEDVTDRDAMRCRHECGSCASRRRRHESAFQKWKCSQPGKAGPATLARTASAHPAHTPRYPNPASRSAMAELYDRSQTNCSGPGSAQARARRRASPLPRSPSEASRDSWRPTPRLCPMPGRTGGRGARADAAPERGPGPRGRPRRRWGRRGGGRSVGTAGRSGTARPAGRRPSGGRRRRRAHGRRYQGLYLQPLR